MWAMAGGNEEVDTKIEEKNEKKKFNNNNNNNNKFW